MSLQAPVCFSRHTICLCGKADFGLQPEIWKIQPYVIISVLFYLSTAQHNIFAWRGHVRELQRGNICSSKEETSWRV